jgi:hypothetical protein
MANPRIDPLELRRLFRYSPSSGKLFWRVSQGGGVKAGDEAGCMNAKGYLRVQIKGRMYLVHVVVMTIFDRAWPEHDVDHWDRDTLNNRLPNLRHATRSQNCASTGAMKTNKLGVKGVCRDRNRYKATIMKDGKKVHLGTRATIDEAAADYWNAAQRLHGEFARAA